MPPALKSCGADQPSSASCFLVSVVRFDFYSFGESLRYKESKLIDSLQQEVVAYFACRSLKGHGADQPTAASCILLSVVDLISTALESLSGSRNEAYRFSLARGRGLLACRSLKGHGADQPTAASCILISVVDLIWPLFC